MDARRGGGRTHLPEQLARWVSTLSRHTVTPDVALAILSIWYDTDVQAILPTVQVPALLLFMDTWQAAREEAECIAALMPRVELRGVPGDVDFGQERQEGALDEIRRFVGAAAASPELDTILATVLFTDIVGSTAKQAALGDHRLKALVERHRAIVRDALGRWRGVENDTAGDGFYAIFDGPARAIRCALEIVEGVRPLGIEIRAGLHTGEYEVIDGKIGGITVSIGARIASKAAPAEVLVSQTVRALVAGSHLTFEDAGEQGLKGVPDRQRLYRVAS